MQPETCGRPWPAVEEPELRRSIVELGMVQGVAVDGAPRSWWRWRPRCPGDASRAELTPADRRAAVGQVPGRRPGRRRPPRHGRRRARGARPPPQGRRAANPLQVVDAAAAQQPPPRVNPFTDTRTRVLAVASGKGGVGKSSVTTNLVDRARRSGVTGVAAVDADVWGFSMPRMLGISAPPGLDRRRHRPARGQRRAPHLDGLLRPRGPGRDLARPDAAQGARAVPHRRLLGRARLPRRSTCRRAPATSRCRSRSSSRAPR